MTGEASLQGGPWIAFGCFRLSFQDRELRRDGRRIDIGERGLDLLLALVARAGQPVSKSALIRAVWGEREVEPSNLTVQVATLRRHLGEPTARSGDHRFIRTMPGHGYIFTGLGNDGAAVEVTTETALPRDEVQVLQSAPHSLQAEPPTRFIGRGNELQALGQLLRTNRLVTLTGMGGVGKTRTALRLSHELLSVFPEGVVFVDLAPLADPSQVNEAVAAAVGAGSGDTNVETALVDALRSRRSLLILDNAEHLAAAVSRLVGLLVASTPHTTLLVTSRESLGVPGEHVFRLSPLELPPDAPVLLAEDALRYDAVRLLLDRARALMPGFRILNADAPHAAAVCRRLDGIALAIEMAVPRLEVLTLRQLAERLHDRFATVPRLRHQASPRQATLRAMFDWSWELLPPGGRDLLQLLALFPAGTTLGPLEALAASDGQGKADTLDTLAILARSSLVVVTHPAPGAVAGARYRLLETTRQYAIEQLPPDRHVWLARQQALVMAARFDQAEAEWPFMASPAWLERYAPDADNLRAAIQWAFATPGETELALRLTAASFSLWWELPSLPLREAQGRYAQAVAAIGPGTPPGIQARLYLGHSWTDTVDGDIESFPLIDRAIGLFREAGDAMGQGAALWRAVGTVLYARHEPTGAALLDEAFRVLAGRGRSKWLALCHVRNADRLRLQEGMVAALAEYDRAWAMMQSSGHSYGLMTCGGNRSYVLFELGRHEEAVASLRALYEVLPPGLRHPLLSLLSMILTALGRDAEARETIRQGLLGTVSIGMAATLARSIEALALLVANMGDGAAAARLLGFALRHHAPTRTRLGPRQMIYERLQQRLAELLSLAAQLREQAIGQDWTEAEAAVAALRLCGEDMGTDTSPGPVLKPGDEPSR